MPSAAAADHKKSSAPGPDAENKAASGRNKDESVKRAAAEPAKTGSSAPKSSETGKAGGSPSKASDTSAGKTSDRAPTAASDAAQRFDRMAVRAKLAVSEPGDAVEREADAVADKVMRAPAPAADGKPQPASRGANAAPRTDAIARAAKSDTPENKTTGAPSSDASPGAGPTAASANADSKPEVKRQTDSDGGAPKEEKPPAVQRKASAPSTQNTTAAGPSANAPAADADVKRKTGPDTAASGASEPRRSTREMLRRLGAGSPLDAAARSYFEPRLGRDLSDVRIHTDDSAAQAAQDLQARAFTFGNHIAFGAGEYQPQSEEGKRLIAHELAHVLQNDGFDIEDRVMRKKKEESNPKYKDANNIDEDAIDPDKKKKAEPALNNLKLPAIKSRHSPIYQKLAAEKGKLKRPKGYDRSLAQFATKQKENWLAGVDLSPHYPSIGFKTDQDPVDLPFYGSKKTSLKGKPKAVEENLKIPNWTAEGLWRDSALQVDHIVEVQVSGPDAMGNYELLTGAHNVNVGSQLRANIYANVKAFLSDIGKNTNDDLVKKYLKTYDVVFDKVTPGGEGKNLEATSKFWSEKQIKAGEHLKWLKVDEKDKAADGDSKTFALFSPTGNALIQKFPRTKKGVTVNDSGALAGLKIKKIVPDDAFDNESTPGGATVGTMTVEWDIPKSIDLKAKGDLSIPLIKMKGKKASAAMGNFPGALDAELQGASPLNFKDITVVGKQVVATGTLKSDIEILKGIEVPVEWAGKDIGFVYMIPLDFLQGKQLPVPGMKIDDASLSLFFLRDRFGAEGMLSFTIANLGGGQVSARVESKGGKPAFGLKGWVEIDKKLFDKSRIDLWYSSDKGFGGKGMVAITDPKKITGVKGAKIEAGYENSTFFAKGGVEPDVPGLKEVSVGVSYGNNTLIIDGMVAADDKLPGIKSGEVNFKVEKKGEDWKVKVDGELEPKIKGLSNAKLKFTYDDGFVYIEGEFNFEKGPLSGKVTAGVTNGTVDEKTGLRSASGEGRNFKIFGGADIDAVLVKDKLYGKVKLRLLPDGSIRVGGGISMKEFQVFPQIPSKAEILREDISTPEIVLFGLPVGLNVVLYVTGHASVKAAVGPGKFKNTFVEVKEFDPNNIELEKLEFIGGTDFEVPAQAGVEVGAEANIAANIVVLQLGGRIGITAEAGLPKDHIAISAKPRFTWSKAKGLSVDAPLLLKLDPQLLFKLKGGLFAKANLLIKKITIWERDWTLAEANFKLPIAIRASADFHYDSTNGLSFNPEKEIRVTKPELGGDDFKDILEGNPSKQKVTTTDLDGKVLEEDEFICRADQPPPPMMSLLPPQNSSQMSTPANQSLLGPLPNPSTSSTPLIGPPPAGGPATGVPVAKKEADRSKSKRKDGSNAVASSGAQLARKAADAEGSKPAAGSTAGGASASGASSSQASPTTAPTPGAPAPGASAPGASAPGASAPGASAPGITSASNHSASTAAHSSPASSAPAPARPSTGASLNAGATAALSGAASKVAEANAAAESAAASAASAAQSGAAGAAAELGANPFDQLGPGMPLDLATRGFFEQRLGRDLSGVRIYIGPAADLIAKEIDAKAFTYGEHIAFAEGEYRPDSEDGRHLLAHELAHVLQQVDGAPPQIMPQRGATRPSAAAAPPVPPPLRDAQRDLVTLEIPMTKRRHSHLYQRWLRERKLKHGPEYDRNSTPPAQVRQWHAELGELTNLNRRLRQLGLPPEFAGRKRLSFNSGERQTKTRSEWMEYFRIPQWDRRGNWLEHRMEVDHIVELQSAGWPNAALGDTVENYEVLDKSTNASSGSTLYNAMVRKMQALMHEERRAGLRTGRGAISREQAQAELFDAGIDFSTVTGGGGSRDDAASHFWSLNEIRRGEQLRALQDEDNEGEAGSRTSFAIVSGPSDGIVVALYRKRSEAREINVSGSASSRISGLDVDHIKLNEDYTSSPQNEVIGEIRGTWVLPQGFRMNNHRFVFRILSASQYSGYLDIPETLSIENESLSPVDLSGISLDRSGVNARGLLTPSVPMLAGSPIDVRWYDGQIEFGKVFTGRDLAIDLPGLTIDQADIGVFFNRGGLRIEGGVDFTIHQLGNGSLRAGLDSEGRFTVEGTIHVDSSVFDEASVGLWYRDGRFGGSGLLAITQPNRIQGVNGASIEVTVDGSHIQARGEVQPNLPGVQNAAISADYAPDTGLTVAGDLELQDFPGIRSGTVHAEMRQVEGLWQVSASGSAVPDLPGVDSEITVSYGNGAFDGQISVDYERGIFSGNVTVGVTNRDVTPDGELAGDDAPPPADGGTLKLYGSGTVTAQLTEWLQGGVGVKIKPSGELLISGRIGIPDAVTIFEQYPAEDQARRDLFRMPTVSVPLVGASVGGSTVGLALTVSGRIEGYAHVGPGRLTEAEIRIEDYNPAQPETLAIEGDATFDVPAAAGVEASLDAGVSLGAAVIRGTAGVSVFAGVGAEAHVTPSVDIAWTPDSGLHLHADLNTTLSPTLNFGVNGYAEVVADAFFASYELWRKDWNLAEIDIGSSLTLGLNVPVDYYSDDRGLVFDPEQVSFQLPELNESTFSQLMNQHGEETVEE